MQQYTNPSGPQPSSEQIDTANKRLTCYLSMKRNRPKDNDIKFWKGFVEENFTYNAKKKWCSSTPGKEQQHAGDGVGLECEICNRKSGKVFEANVKDFPKLYQIEYENGMLEKLLYTDYPLERYNSAGQTIVDYPKTTVERRFDQYHFYYDCHLRIVFSPEFKIHSLEICSWNDNLLISGKSLMPQLKAAAKQYQVSSSHGHTASLSELQSYCNWFVGLTKQLSTKVLDGLQTGTGPIGNQFGHVRNEVNKQFQQRDKSEMKRLRNLPVGFDKLEAAQRILMHFMSLLLNRDNSQKDYNKIESWKTFVSENFTCDAKKKWCGSMPGVGLQEEWQCDICNQKRKNSFGVNVKLLPRLYQIEYESGMLEKLFYIYDIQVYQNSVGQIIINCPNIIEQSVFDKHRSFCEGHLRVVFSPELKICSWEFCGHSQYELISQQSLIPQVNQLRASAEQYQAASSQVQNASLSELKSYCNEFVASVKQLIQVVNRPVTIRLENSAKFTRALETTEVMYCMKNLMDYSIRTGTGPIESLAKFSRITSAPYEQIQRQEQMQQVNPTDGVLTGWNQNQMNPMNPMNQNQMNPRPQYPLTRTTDSSEPWNSHNISFQQQEALSHIRVQDSMVNNVTTGRSDTTDGDDDAEQFDWKAFITEPSNKADTSGDFEERNGSPME